MSNILLAKTPNDTATLSGGSWTLPLTNLQTPKLATKARSASDALADTCFRIDQGSDLPVRSISLHKHNLSTSALWRVRYGRASLWLDLTQDRLDSRITFNRTTTRTYYGADGLRATAAVDTWPVEYDPYTLERKSRAVWRASTNDYLYARDLSNAAWTKTATTITSNADIGADGTTSMDKLVEDSTTASHALTQSRNVTSGTIYAESCDAKAGERRYLQMTLSSSGFGATVCAVFDLMSGVFTTNGNGTGTEATMQRLQNDVYRCTLSAQATANVAVVNQYRIALTYSASPVTHLGDGTSGLYLDCLQSESGRPSPFIDTTSTTVTRGIDNARVTSLTGIYTSGSVTVISRADFASVGASNSGQHEHIFSFHGATGNDTMRLLRLAGTTLLHHYVQTNAGGAQAALNINVGVPLVARTPMWAACRFSNNNVRGSAAGVAVVSDTVASLATVTSLYLGSYAGTQLALNGFLYDLVVCPESLNDTNLLAAGLSGPTALPSLFYDSGWVSALQMTQQVTYGNIATTWGQAYPVLALPTETVTGQYGEIEFNDTSNAAGYVEFGRLFIADGLQIDVNAQWGLSDGHKDMSTVMENPAGRITAKTQNRSKEVTFTYGELTLTEGDQLHQLDGWLGTTGEVVYIPDPADLPKSQQYGFLGRFSDVTALDYPTFNTRSKVVKIVEKL